MKPFSFRSTSIIISIFALAVSPFSLAQTPATGTRVQGGGASTHRQVIQFAEPGEIRNIRRLLGQGKGEEARVLAHEYLETVKYSTTDAPTRYFAYSAMCAVQTFTKEFELAEDNCSVAIEIMPGNWSALNNRGTVRLLTENFDGAMNDYSRALEVAGNQNVIATINHNMEITRNRMR